MKKEQEILPRPEKNKDGALTATVNNRTFSSAILNDGLPNGVSQHPGVSFWDCNGVETLHPLSLPRS